MTPTCNLQDPVTDSCRRPGGRCRQTVGPNSKRFLADASWLTHGRICQQSKAAWLQLSAAALEYSSVECRFDFTPGQAAMKFTTSDQSLEQLIVDMVAEKKRNAAPITDFLVSP